MPYAPKWGLQEKKERDTEKSAKKKEWEKETKNKETKKIENLC
jgi:hypothetical protein